ncbi:hypothetical protein HSE3_gp051 [Klebsiella phage vB_KleS-HSE3]|nr:hypothetical protein HSE3_gp051 [Klebsiella phage vB_KleS-HSE3]
MLSVYDDGERTNIALNTVRVHSAVEPTVSRINRATNDNVIELRATIFTDAPALRAIHEVVGLDLVADLRVGDRAVADQRFLHVRHAVLNNERVSFVCPASVHGEGVGHDQELRGSACVDPKLNPSDARVAAAGVSLNFDAPLSRQLAVDICNRRRGLLNCGAHAIH